MKSSEHNLSEGSTNQNILDKKKEMSSEQLINKSRKQISQEPFNESFSEPYVQLAQENDDETAFIQPPMNNAQETVHRKIDIAQHTSSPVRVKSPKKQSELTSKNQGNQKRKLSNIETDASVEDESEKKKKKIQSPQRKQSFIDPEESFILSSDSGSEQIPTIKAVKNSDSLRVNQESPKKVSLLAKSLEVSTPTKRVLRNRVLDTEETLHKKHETVSKTPSKLKSPVSIRIKPKLTADDTIPQKDEARIIETRQLRSSILSSQPEQFNQKQKDLENLPKTRKSSRLKNDLKNSPTKSQDVTKAETNNSTKIFKVDEKTVKEQQSSHQNILSNEPLKDSQCEQSLKEKSKRTLSTEISPAKLTQVMPTKIKALQPSSINDRPSKTLLTQPTSPTTMQTQTTPTKTTPTKVTPRKTRSSQPSSNKGTPSIPSTKTGFIPAKTKIITPTKITQSKTTRTPTKTTRTPTTVTPRKIRISQPSPGNNTLSKLSATRTTRLSSLSKLAPEKSITEKSPVPSSRISPSSTKTRFEDTTLVEDNKPLSPEREEEEFTEEQEITENVIGKKSKEMKTKVVKFSWQSKRQSGRLRRRLDQPVASTVSNDQEEDLTETTKYNDQQVKKPNDQYLPGIKKSNDQVEPAKLNDKLHDKEDSIRVKEVENTENEVSTTVEDSLSKGHDTDLAPSVEEVNSKVANIQKDKEFCKESEEFLRKYDLLQSEDIGLEQESKKEHQENDILKSNVSTQQDGIEDQQDSNESVSLSYKIKVEEEIPSPVFSDSVSREEVDDFVVVCQDSDDDDGDDENELMKTSSSGSSIVQRETDTKDAADNSQNIDNTDDVPVSVSSPLPLPRPDDVEDVKNKHIPKSLDNVGLSHDKNVDKTSIPKDTELEFHSKSMDENNMTSLKPESKTESSIPFPPIDLSAHTDLVAEIPSVDSTVQPYSKSGKENKLKQIKQETPEKTKSEHSREDDVKIKQPRVDNVIKKTERSDDSQPPSKPTTIIELPSFHVSASLSQAPTTSQATSQQQQSPLSLKKAGGSRLSQRFKYSKFGTRLSSSSIQQKSSETTTSSSASVVKTENKDATREREKEVQLQPQETITQGVLEEKKLITEEDVEAQLGEDEDDDHEDIDFCIEPTGKSAFYLLPAPSISAADSEDSEVEILENQELEEDDISGDAANTESTGNGMVTKDIRDSSVVNDAESNRNENMSEKLIEDARKAEEIIGNDVLDNVYNANVKISEDSSKKEAAELTITDSAETAPVNHAANELEHVEDKQDKHDKAETVTIKQNK